MMNERIEFLSFSQIENFYQLRSIEHEYSEYLDEKTSTTPLLTILILILIGSVFVFVYYDNLNQHLLPRLHSLYQQIAHRSIVPADSAFTFIRFSSDHDVDGLEMEISGRQQATSNEGFRLRTKNDSISSNISSKSVLFTVDEQDENISFDNPFFKQDADLPNQTDRSNDEEQQM